MSELSEFPTIELSNCIFTEFPNRELPKQSTLHGLAGEKGSKIYC